jgi:hypothetical protein
LQGFTSEITQSNARKSQWEYWDELENKQDGDIRCSYSGKFELQINNDSLGILQLRVSGGDERVFYHYVISSL